MPSRPRPGRKPRITRRSEALVNDEKRENVRATRRDDLRSINRSKFRRELLEYFTARQRRREVVLTTQTPSGQVLDWVPIELQPGLRGRIASPPSESVSLSLGSGKRRLELVQFELQRPDVQRGPDGTIPIPRRNLKQLRFVRSLEDHLSKHGHPSYRMYINDDVMVQVPGSGAGHEYAYSSQSVKCFGAEGNLAAFDPYVHRADEFSLLQVALARGADNNQQTVEAGWQEYRDLYGDWLPRLFVFFTTNNYAKQGNNVGGYNRDVDGWVQFDNTVFPEAISNPTTTRGGRQYMMQIKYQLYRENWWFCCNGRWIGYYPASLFNSKGLRNEASSVSFYGEIVDSDKDDHSSWTDMGSGYWPSEDWQWSAYMSHLRSQSKADGTMVKYSGSTWESNPEEYAIKEHFGNSGSWGSYCWVGGPGGG